MNKQFQKIKILMIFLMLLCSSLYFISPIGKSAPLDPIYECKPIIIIEYDETLLQDLIVPYDEPRKIPIVIKAKIVGPAADIVTEKIGGGGILFIVDMSIAEVSEGVTASINPPIITFEVSDKFVSANATISITIDKYLPAFSLKNIKVRMNSRRLGSSKATLVKPGNFSQDIPFFVGYIPQLSFAYPKGNVKTINPDETANFTIEIQNWGNADTKVYTEIVDLPDGWLAEIDKNITLGSSLFDSNGKKTISLNVKPPISFGYHEDRAIIKVKMTPVFYNDSNYSGEPHYLYFIVQSEGFATPGFEMITILLGFIFVIIPICKRKNNNKINEKQSGRKKE